MASPMSETSNPNITSGRRRWFVKTLELCLLVGSIYFVIRSVIGFLSPESLWSTNSANVRNAAAVQNAGPVIDARAGLSASLSSFDPFHRKRAPDAEIDIIAQSVPETKLDLRLFGLRSGEGGSAILQTPDKKQGVFKVGQEIIDGVVLKSVSSNLSLIHI